MWWRVLAGTQPGACWSGLKTDQRHLRLAESAHRYEPGIYRVWLDLAAHWRPEAGRTVDKVRTLAKATGETLAHAEVLAAYAIHAALLREQDGTNLPFADLARYEVTVPGVHPWRGVPCVRWSGAYRKVRLGASWAGDRDGRWAAPVFRKS